MRIRLITHQIYIKQKGGINASLILIVRIEYYFPNLYPTESAKRRLFILKSASPPGITFPKP